MREDIAIDVVRDVIDATIKQLHEHGVYYTVLQEHPNLESMLFDKIFGIFESMVVTDPAHDRYIPICGGRQ